MCVYILLIHSFGISLSIVFYANPSLAFDGHALILCDFLYGISVCPPDVTQISILNHF